MTNIISLTYSVSVALSSAEHLRTMAMQNDLNDLQRRFDETLAENKVLKQIQVITASIVSCVKSSSCFAWESVFQIPQKQIVDYMSKRREKYFCLSTVIDA